MVRYQPPKQPVMIPGPERKMLSFTPDPNSAQPLESEKKTGIFFNQNFLIDECSKFLTGQWRNKNEIDRTLRSFTRPRGFRVERKKTNKRKDNAVLLVYKCNKRSWVTHKNALGD